MTSDIALAFAHPEDRAAASASLDPRDRISLRDYILEADIGAFQKERGHKQRLRFNVVVEVGAAAQPLEDDVDRILSYDRITEEIVDALAKHRLNLLETLAENIAEGILAEPQAMRVFVRVEKLDVGPYALGVEIVRARAEVPMRHDGDALHPLMVYLDNDTIHGPNLATVIDQLQNRNRALVFCVGLPQDQVLQTGQEATQRRVDLLAIEQNAWVLAAKDPRCVVVSSRTELEWAMRRGQPVVWAPSKLVLDAVDGPQGRAPLALALWLGEQLSAEAFVIYGGGEAPSGSRLQIEQADCVN